MSYALEGYRQLTHPLQTQNKVELIKLVDHKVQLPTDIKYLNMVFCMTNTSDNINIDLATTDTENTDVETVTTYTETDGTVVTITEREFTDRYLLNHRLYLHNTFYNNAYFNNLENSNQ